MIPVADYYRSHSSPRRKSGKKIYDKDISRMVRRNLDRLERDTVSTSSLSREQLVNLLELDAVASYRTAGDHALQKLVHDGVLSSPKRRFDGGPKVFDRDDTISALRAYAGA